MIFHIISSFILSASANSFDLAQEVQHYQQKYTLTDTLQRGTNNYGQGDDKIYGTRNFRVVLPGVFYRGGANNKFLESPRANMNPLPQVGLDNLCQEGFETAIYLYAENYSTAPKSVSCRTNQGQAKMSYKHHAAYGENKKILEMVYKRIKGKTDGPIYAHCWNGWHSSGMISAMVLKQFCGMSDEAAEAYWVNHTDGHSKGFPKIRQRVREFKPYKEFAISESEQKLICPQANLSF